MLTGPSTTIAKARKLRREMSLPEVLLWQQLRKRPDGYKFRRQHPAGAFILDFACLEARIAIEIDGRAHDARPDRDKARDDWLEAQGFQTIRIPASAVLGDLDAVVHHIVASCRIAVTPLHRPPGGPPPRFGEEF